MTERASWIHLADFLLPKGKDMPDYEMRKAAMDTAVTSTNNEVKTTDLIARAAAIYRFLNGGSAGRPARPSTRPKPAAKAKRSTPKPSFSRARSR